jgi:gliding motility-associated-like protein
MIRNVIYLLWLSLWLNASIVLGQNVVLSTLDGNLYEFDGATCTTRFLIRVPTALYDISYHPNGKLYGINGTGALYEIDLNSGNINLVHLFTQAPDDFVNSMTTDLEGVIYVMGPAGYLQSFHLDTQEEIFYGQYEFGATGDLTFFDGNLYAAVAGDRILRLDLEDPASSEVVINQRLDGSIWGIISFDKACGDINTYVVTTGRDAIYELDFEEDRFIKLCDLRIEPSGGASKFEFISSREIEILQEEIVQPTCNQADGSYSIEASYPLDSLSYSLNGIQSSGGRWTNLASDDYQLIITAGAFCIYSDIIALNADDVEYEVRNIERPDCGEENGSFEIAISNGSPPFEIFVNQRLLGENALFNLPSDDYIITITDSLGCEETSAFYLASLRCPFDIPNIFSPNGDNTNDVFQIRLHSDFNGSIVQFHIFDRWGNQVFTNEDPNAFSSWDGTFNGNQVSEGVYSYILQVLYEDGFLETKAGSLTLVR